jgi:hypothetical protein
MSELARLLYAKRKNTAIAHSNHRLSDVFHCLFNVPLRLTTLVLEGKDEPLPKKIQKTLKTD